MSTFSRRVICASNAAARSVASWESSHPGSAGGAVPDLVLDASAGRSAAALARVGVVRKRTEAAATAATRIAPLRTPMDEDILYSSRQGLRSVLCHRVCAVAGPKWERLHCNASTTGRSV